MRYCLGQSRQVQEDLKNKYINQDTLQHLKSLSTEFNDSDFSIEAIESILKNYVKNADLKFPQIAMHWGLFSLGWIIPLSGHIISIIGKELFNKEWIGFYKWQINKIRIFNEIISKSINVSVYLMNGIKLQGLIESYDEEVLS